MKHASRFSALLAGYLACLSPTLSAAIAHSPVVPTFPIHHAAVFLAKPLLKPVIPHHAGTSFALSAILSKGSSRLFLSKSSTQLAVASLNASLPGPGSLATRHVAALIRSVVVSGISTGEAKGAAQVQVSPFTGGNVVSGQLQGDLYTGNSSGLYFNAGEFSGTVGTNIPANRFTNGEALEGAGSLIPGFQNTLTFAPQQVVSIQPLSNHGSGGGVSSSFLLGKVSGSQRSFLSQLFSLSGSSVGLGEKIGVTRALALPHSVFSGGALSGGIFYGTAYRNSYGTSAYQALSFSAGPQYIFAFGNNPLNNPAGKFSYITIPTAKSMVVFANGLSKTVTSGQILYPMFGPAPYLAQNGSVLTFGANPANNGITGSLITNLNSFLFF